MTERRLLAFIRFVLVGSVFLSLPVLADDADDLKKQLQMAKDQAELDRQRTQNLYDQLKLVSDIQALSTLSKEGKAVTNDKLPDMLATRALAWTAADEAATCFCEAKEFMDFAKGRTLVSTNVPDPFQVASKASIAYEQLKNLYTTVKGAGQPKIAFAGGAVAAIVAAQVVVSFAVQASKMLRSDYEILSKQQDVPQDAILSRRCRVEILSSEAIFRGPAYAAYVNELTKKLDSLRQASEDLEEKLPSKADKYSSSDTAKKRIVDEANETRIAMAKPEAIQAMATGLVLNDKLNAASLITAEVKAENVQIHKSAWHGDTSKSLATGWISMVAWSAPGTKSFYGVATKSTDAIKLDFDRMSELNRVWMAPGASQCQLKAK